VANPAAEARAQVKAAHPEAVVVERGRNSIKHRLADQPDGRQRFALDVAIGPLHYGPSNDQEIDTALVPSTAPWDWEMTKAGFEVRALSNLSAGQVIEYRSGSEWVRFQPMALQYSNDLNQIQQISMPQAVDAAVDDDTLIWTDGYGPGRTLSWQAQTARLAKLLTISAPSDLPTVEQFILDGGNPVLELNLIFAHSSGVTPYVNGQEWKRGDRDTQGLVEFRDDKGNVFWWFNLPRSWDSEGDEQLGTFRFKKQGNSLYVSHRVPLSFVQGAAYPLIVDVDVDEQVGAALDDANEDDDNTDFDTALFDLSSNAVQAGVSNIGARFQTVSVGNSDTIDLATFSVISKFTFNNNVNADFYAEDVDDAVNFSDTADVTDRVRTMASVSWVENAISNTVFNDSPEIKTLIQEVVNRGGWVFGQDMVILGIGKSDLTKLALLENYDSDTAQAAKLHIEYTAGGGGVTSTPFTATLSLSTLIPTASTPQIITPGVINLSTATFTPIVGLSVIPPPIALSITSFISTITTTNNIIVTPDVVVLSLNAFVPVIKLGITPPTLALSLTTFIPTISISDNKLVIIPTTNLSVSLFVSTISTPHISTLPTSSLSLAAFVPIVTVTGNQIIIPNTGTLLLSILVPTIAISDHKVVTPSTLTTNLTIFIPVVTSIAGVIVIPPTANLLSTLFSPSTLTPILVTPSVLTLVVSTFAPISIVPITATLNVGILSLSSLVPTIAISGNQVATPLILILTLTEFAPTITTPYITTPPTLVLTLTKFVPTTRLGIVVTPNVIALSSTTFIPTIKLPVTATPNTITPTLTLLVPVVSISGGETIISGTLTLTLVSFIPTIAKSTYESYGAPFLYTSVNWGEKVEFYLETYLKATSNIARARLINATDGSVVADSELSTNSITYERLRSSALSLVDGKTYFVQFGTEDESSGAFKNAKIVVV